jgi:hypothetical protein
MDCVHNHRHPWDLSPIWKHWRTSFDNIERASPQRQAAPVVRF